LFSSICLVSTNSGYSYSSIPKLRRFTRLSSRILYGALLECISWREASASGRGSVRQAARTTLSPYRLRTGSFEEDGGREIEELYYQETGSEQSISLFDVAPPGYDLSDDLKWLWKDFRRHLQWAAHCHLEYIDWKGGWEC